MRRVVVLGGGFCGLNTILQLQDAFASRSRVELVLVEPSAQFVFKPLLSDVACSTTPAHRATVPYRQLIDDERVRWLRDTAVGLDADDQILHLADRGPLEWDSLVITVGSVVKPDPDVVADSEGVLCPYSLEDALRLRSALAHPERESPLDICIVGGGCVGVELAGSLCAAEHAGAVGLPVDSRVTLLERHSRLVPDMDDGVAGEAYRSLSGWGVDVELGAEVSAVNDGVVALSDGRELQPDIVVWAGGVKAAGFAAQSELPLDDQGRIQVDSDLRVHNRGELYAAGDIAAVKGETIPRRVEVALQQARLVAQNVNAGMTGRMRSSYQYKPGVEVLDLGGRRAAAVYQGVLLRGRMAWGVRHLALASMAPSLTQKLALATDIGGALLSRSARLLSRD